MSKIFVAAVMASVIASHAQAAPISLTPGTASCPAPPCLVLSGAGSQNDANLAIAAALGITVAELNSLLLYQSTQSDASEDGSWAPSYSTSYVGAPTAYAEISWDGLPNPFISANPVYAYIKDGNLDPGWYFFNITGWNGQDAVEFSGFYGGNQGKISHVSLYGTEREYDVPDGGSMLLLLGMALGGLAGVRRMLD